ncbi:hypothetical protein L6452_24953 [Arctium lappa]|uniref:Uncharacterized protein n=1 Tax=Arctium lappa TaxID=4217 RepID=A0ACB9A9L5_ARCLA|nr:hypothetical protein L6452_24953 [Arctium lappa]
MCLLRRSIFRWPEFDANGIHIVSSYFTTAWSWTSHNLSQITAGWSSHGFRRLDIWIVDDLLWNVVMAVESLVLAFMLGCYFVFCGCTL